jgi:hypothetical protein
MAASTTETPYLPDSSDTIIDQILTKDTTLLPNITNTVDQSTNYVSIETPLSPAIIATIDQFIYDESPLLLYETSLTDKTTPDASEIVYRLLVFQFLPKIF